DVSIEMKKNPSYKVRKMKCPKINREENKKTIIFNSDITINDIPLKAYDYLINGKPAIDVIIEQYQVSTDKGSGIIHDPNLYSENEKYI
ncbi:type ISP restriction/modification enzyme, partial [Pantoea sp. SIMBA_133]